MRFVSTRGFAPPTNFQSALFEGLAPDGGLYVPGRIDRMPVETLRQMGRTGRRIFEEKFTSQRMNTAIVDLYKESLLP